MVDALNEARLYRTFGDDIPHQYHFDPHYDHIPHQYNDEPHVKEPKLLRIDNMWKLKCEKERTQCRHVVGM